MKNKSSTKKSLLFSVLSLFLSLVLLAGTTFAWFTDTASTSVNTIHSGTLDITLKDTAGNSLEGQSLSFLRKAENGILAPADDILWEPGATFETYSFHVVNQGNLAVKYKILLNQPEGSGKLAEVIDWSIQIGDVKHSTIPGSNLMINTSDYVGHLGPNDTSEDIKIIAHMQEDAGNDYQNLTLTGISFKVLATQDTVEYDSSTNMYDELADWDESAASVLNPDPVVDLILPDPQASDPDTSDPDSPGDGSVYTFFAYQPYGTAWTPGTVTDENGDENPNNTNPIIYDNFGTFGYNGDNVDLLYSGDSGNSDIGGLSKQSDSDYVQFLLPQTSNTYKIVVSLPSGYIVGPNNEIIGPEGEYYMLQQDATTGSWTLVETDEPWTPSPSPGANYGILNIRTGQWITP